MCFDRARVLDRISRSRSAVVRRQNQRHLRADTSAQEAQELEHDEEEDSLDTNAFAEAGCIAERDTENERNAKADNLSQSNRFADAHGRTFCNTDAQELPIAFVEKERQKEGFTQSVAERHTLPVA